MIVLFTDFGLSGPYIGQMKSVIIQNAPGTNIVDLISDAPNYDPATCAHLLAGYVKSFPESTIFLCVVDPGVGSENRLPIILKIDNYWYVGPHNGLFDVVVNRAKTKVTAWEITWRPEYLSNSFHGRDLFSPIAAMLVNNQTVPSSEISLQPILDLNDLNEIFKVIYIDTFGNGITGLPFKPEYINRELKINKYSLAYAKTYAEVSKGQGFWYENSNGLIEIAVNQGSAKEILDINIGDLFEF